MLYLIPKMQVNSYLNTASLQLDSVPHMNIRKDVQTACLIIALLMACLLAALLSPIISNRYVEAFPGEGVTVTYVRNPPFLSSRLPLLRVKDLSGHRIDGVIINLFAVMPNARVRYVGSAGNLGNTLILPQRYVVKFTKEIIPAWRGKLGSIEGFETSLIAFINIIRKTGSGDYVSYPYVTTIPLNPSALSKGYTMNSITITINTKSIKPTRIKVTNTPKPISTNATTRPQTSLNLSPQNTIGPNCVPLHGRPENFVYCVEWRLEKEYAHLENTLIPIIALRIPYGYYTDPQAVFEISLSFNFQERTSAYFKVYAGIKLSNAFQISYESVETLEDFSFTYYKHFFNSRWSREKPSFTDDATIVVGFKGSATLGLFREYDAFCENDEPWCPEEDYVPTDTTANATLMDINVRYDGQRWTAPYSYSIDDVVGDGAGWDKYWDLTKEHAQPGETASGTGEATYFYSSSANTENYVGVDIADLVAMIVKDPKLPSYFPVDAGIGFGVKEAHTETIIADVCNEVKYSDYFVSLTSYVSRDEVCIDGTYAHLKLMLFDTEDYSPW